MANRQENRLIPNGYVKNSIVHSISFQFDEVTKKDILKILKKNSDDEIGKDFIEAMQIQVGMYIEVKRQQANYESTKVVEKKINQTLKRIASLILSLDEIAQSDEVLNRLNILLPTFRNIEERLAFYKDRDDQPLPNRVNDALLNQKQHLENLNNLLLVAKKLGTQNTQGGRPRKDLRVIYIREFAKVFECYIGKPSLTEFGKFESVIQICLEAANDKVEEIHQILVDILKPRQV